MLSIDHVDSRGCCSMTMLEKPRWKHGDAQRRPRCTQGGSEGEDSTPKGAGPLLYGEMMNCPYCSSMSCTRSLRYGVRDSVRRLLGLFPWDCRTCRTRFYWRKRYPDRRPYHHTRSVPGSGGQSRWPEGAGPMRNPLIPMNRGASDVSVQPGR